MPADAAALGGALDEDAVLACTDLARRSGGKEFEIGYLHDDPTGAQRATNWYAHVQYRGARLTGQGPGPVEAADSLARRILAGGICIHCGAKISLSGLHQPTACWWRRLGDRWQRGCAEDAG
jgi:hypothetical protein